MLILIQILFFIGGLAAVFEEAAFTWPFRSLDETVFPLPKKEELSAIFHRFGWVQIVLFAAAASASAFFIYGSYWARISHFFLWSLAAGLSYMLSFNPGYSLKIGKGPFYLGNSATEDKFFNKKLGKYAGAIVFFGTIIILIAINYIN